MIERLSPLAVSRGGNHCCGGISSLLAAVGTTNRAVKANDAC
jgi:hypothetical protein